MFIVLGQSPNVCIGCVIDKWDLTDRRPVKPFKVLQLMKGNEMTSNFSCLLIFYQFG